MAGAAKKHVKYSYIPFGGGKRSCIGGAMSQVENTLALSLLLRRFRPEYVGDVPPRLNATVTLTPKGGLKFRIRDLN
jgi:cytochrome P450